MYTLVSTTGALTGTFHGVPDGGAVYDNCGPGEEYEINYNTTGSPHTVTATLIAVSSATPTVGTSVTYAATVTPAHVGPTEPSGSVEFLDGGAAIGSCASPPLKAGSSSSAAVCTLSYS